MTTLNIIEGLFPYRLSRTYRISNLIGRGGSGKVYRAIHVPTKKVVAVKKLHSTKSRSAIDRFRREARQTKRLLHEHICRVYDFGIAQDGKTPFYAMELLKGKTLGEHLKEDPLPDKTILQIVSQILDALEEAHENGIVHRDIKPSNIHISFEKGCAVAKLIDFGLLKILKRVSHTSDDIVLGTPYYIAPEQALNRKVGKHTDIFAVGAVLYECLTGRKLFDGNDMQSIVKAIALARPFALPGALNQLIPRAVEDIIIRATAHFPKDRYDNVRQMKEAIDQAINTMQLMPRNEFLKTTTDLKVTDFYRPKNGS